MKHTRQNSVRLQYSSRHQRERRVEIAHALFHRNRPCVVSSNHQNKIMTTVRLFPSFCNIHSCKTRIVPFHSPFLQESLFVPKLWQSLPTLLPQQQQQVRSATKKAGGSSNNGRDSAGRRLGVKVFPAARKYITAGSIIIRQRGTKFYPGENAGMGRDHTIYSRIDGYVQFDPHETKKKRHVVHILPTLKETNS